MFEKYKIVTGILAVSVSPMLGHYIHGSVGLSAGIFGSLMITWGFLEV